MTENTMIEGLKKEILRLETALADGYLAQEVNECYQEYRDAVKRAEGAQGRLDDALKVLDVWIRSTTPAGDFDVDTDIRNNNAGAWYEQQITHEEFAEMVRLTGQSAAPHDGISLYSEDYNQETEEA